MEHQYNADAIRTTNAAEAVRLRPTLYFQKCFDAQSLNALPFEVLCHAFDEYCDGNCSEILITIAGRYFKVDYNACVSLELQADGLSVAERMMTQVFACRQEKKHRLVGDEFCSIGMAIINFATEHCELTTASNGTKGTFVFKDGVTIVRNFESHHPEEKRTSIVVSPDRSIFEKLNFQIDGLIRTADRIMSEMPDLKISVVQADTISSSFIPAL